MVASNADLSSTRAGGLRTDLAASFLDELAETAGLTIHVRLIEGELHASRARAARLADLSKRLSRAVRDPDDMLREIVRAVTEIVPSSRWA